MTEKPEASVLTARRAAQHFRLSSADDACEHLYILIVRSSLGPPPPNAGRYTVASRFRRRSCERGYLVQGLQNGALPPRSASRVAGPHYWGPALSEPYLRLSPYTAQAL